MSPGQGQDPQGVGIYSLHQGCAEPRVLLDGPQAHEVAPGAEAPPALTAGSVPHCRNPAPFRHLSQSRSSFPDILETLSSALDWTGS